MTRVTFVAPDGIARTIVAEPGLSVMEVAVRNGIPGIEAECGGACACATCHVHVEADFWSDIAPSKEAEREMLGFAKGVGPLSRLACQIKLTSELEALVVHTPTDQG